MMPLRLQEKAQSLVETAIILPLLIIMFLGVLEVGHALRIYMVLLNASRETARFLARDVYTDAQGLAHFQNALAGQADVRPGENATIYIHHATLCAGSPFDEGDGVWEYWRTVEGALLPTQVVGDTLRVEMIAYNDEANQVLYTHELALAEADELEQRHAALLAHDFETAPVEWACEELVIVEVPYRHAQLVGLFGQFKIPMRVETAMRVVSSRGAR